MSDDMKEVLIKEVVRRPGVSWEISRARKHGRLTVTVNGRSRFLMFTTTPVEGRGVKNKVAELRRLIKELRDGK